MVNRPKGSINQQGLMHVADIKPTLLEIAGTSYPETYAGKETLPTYGKSWGAVLAGQAESPRTDQDVLGWEIFGNRAVRQGNWKLRWQIRPLGTGEWELFDLAADPGEMHDLAAGRPEKVQEMLALWEVYAQQNNVILPNRTVFESSREGPPPARAGPGRIPAGQPEAAVRAARGHARRSEVVNADASRIFAKETMVCLKRSVQGEGSHGWGSFLRRSSPWACSAR